MSNTTKNIIIGIAIGLVIAVLGGIMLSSQTVTNLGGTVSLYPTSFVNGLKAGTSNQLSISSAGAITTSGSVTTSGAIALTGGTTIGSTGSSISKLVFGTCNLTVGTIATSSVGNATCGATGAVAGDKVFVLSASTTPAGFHIVGASASSTANYLTVVVYNDDVSATTTVPATIKNNVQYLIVR